MPTLDSLVTKMAADKGYSGESPAKDGLPGFVCPRANAYGGREGLIPPGVAAVNGLVPRGMKQVTIRDISRSADVARSDGMTESERYKAYYGAALAASAGQDKTNDTVGPTDTASTGGTVKQGSSSPAIAVKPPAVKPVKSVKPRKTGKTPAATPITPGTPVTPVTPVEVLDVELDNGFDDVGGVGVMLEGMGVVVVPGMFSEEEAGVGGDDTLDDFYAGLSGIGFGTKEGGPAAGKGVVSPDPGGTGGARPTPGSHARDVIAERKAERADEEPVAVLALRVLSEDNERLRARVAELEGTAAGQDYERMAAASMVSTLKDENDNLRAELASRTAASSGPGGGTVRVVLSSPEGRIKIGGRDWECSIMGAVHLSRTGTGAILTVTDPGYSSELLASIQQGDVVIVTDGGRYSCKYSGDCVKIYGDIDAQDFIACFRVDDLVAQG